MTWPVWSDTLERFFTLTRQIGQNVRLWNSHEGILLILPSTMELAVKMLYRGSFNLTMTAI